MRNRWISPELREKSPKVTREELFELVWQEPIYKIGPRFGLSGNGLAKLCKRFDIPVPSLGHWTKLQHGKDVKRPKLPPTPEGQDDVIKIIPSELRQVDLENNLPDDIVSQIAELRSLDKPIKVPKNGELHLSYEKVLTSRNWIGATPTKERISALERRRRNILSALIHEVEKRNGSLGERERYKLEFTIAGEKIEFSLHEAYRQVRRPFTPDEKKWRSGDEAVELTGTDILRFHVEGYFNKPIQRTWSDGSRGKLEEKIIEILIGLYIVAAYIRENRLEREERERRHREAEIARWQAEDKARKRKAQVDQLLGHATTWSNADLIRSYVQAAIAARDGIADPDKLRAWVQWALEIANELDPLKTELDTASRESEIPTKVQ